MDKSNFESISTNAQLVSKFRFKTGIFPSEMAYLLAAIESQNCTDVIDSGRGPDAFSAIVLNEFLCNNPKIRSVYSIDYAKFIRMKFYTENVFSKNTKFLIGNSFDVIPSLYRKGVSSNLAIIIDGPKHKDQILLALLVIRHIRPRVLALHNSPPESFQSAVLNPTNLGQYYENFNFTSESFSKLLKIDVTDSRRTLDQSSLLLFINPDFPRNIPFRINLQLAVLSCLRYLKIKVPYFNQVYRLIVYVPRKVLYKAMSTKVPAVNYFRKIRKRLILLFYPLYKLVTR